MPAMTFGTYAAVVFARSPVSKALVAASSGAGSGWSAR